MLRGSHSVRANVARRDRLTAKQRQLQREVNELLELLHLDPHSIVEYDRSIRTAKLEWMMRWLARAAVVEAYTFVDELLADQICWFYFGRKQAFWKQWRTKRFATFNHYILQNMYPLEKLRLLKAFREVPRKIGGDIQDLNMLRNALAHAFFPENLKHAKPSWKGKSIFRLEALRVFLEDMQRVRDFFFQDRAYSRQGRIVRVRRTTAAKPGPGEQANQGSANPS
jgi:hypothetical protein